MENININNHKGFSFDYDLDDLKNHIHIGKENAISAKSLSEKIGFTDRVVHEIIAQARFAGQDICSSSRGYYYAKNEEELLDFVEQIEKRARHSFAILKTMRPKVKDARQKREELRKARQTQQPVTAE